eukprot:5385974-Amphidinium_carterae.5
MKGPIEKTLPKSTHFGGFVCGCGAWWVMATHVKAWLFCTLAAIAVQPSRHRELRELVAKLPQRIASKQWAHGIPVEEHNMNN